VLTEIALVGEVSLERLLKRDDSCMDRVNHNAIVDIHPHSADEVAQIVRERCEHPVSVDVGHAIHNELSQINSDSVRAVEDWIEGIEQYCMSSVDQVEEFTMEHWKSLNRRAFELPEKKKLKAVDGAA
jgi:hypothetical protein